MTVFLTGVSVFLLATAWARSPLGLASLRLRFAGANLPVLEVLDRESEFERWFQRTLLFAVGGFAVGVLAQGIGAGLLVAVVAALAPSLYLRVLRRRRIEAVERQFPAALEAMASALRAGQSLPQAVQWVAGEAPSPTAEEYARLSSEVVLGRPVEEVFQAMNDRVPAPGLRTFTMILGPLRSMGANLVPAFEGLSELLRRRAGMDEKLRTMTAQGRMQLMVMAGLLPVLTLILYAIAPHFIAPLFVTAGGKLVVISALFLQASGLWLAKRVLKPERMWRDG